MPDASDCLRLDLSQARLVAEGGTRRIYRHDAFPGLALKRFKKPPDRHDLDVLSDNREFAGFLLGESPCRQMLVRDGAIERTEPIVLQRWCDAAANATQIRLSYWELRSDVPEGPRNSAAVADVLDHLVVSEEFARPLMDICTDDPGFRTRLDAFYWALLAYCARTGLVFDLAGANLFAFHDGEWRLEAVDGLKGDRLRAGLDLERAEGPISLRATAELINVCNFFRLMFFFEHLLSTASLSRRYRACWDAALAALNAPGHGENLRSLRTFAAMVPPS